METPAHKPNSSHISTPRPPVRPVPHMGEGGGLHRKTVPQYHSVNQLRRLRCLVKIFSGAFGAYHFLCFLG